jgi:hypothetical protein
VARCRLLPPNAWSPMPVANRGGSTPYGVVEPR